MQPHPDASRPAADRPEPRAAGRPDAADVPSDLLWRQAIQATRDAASVAAELRRALGTRLPAR